LPVPCNLAHGSQSGDTGYFGRPGGLPLEQTPDDARALCFETAPLTDPLDIVGAASLSVTLARRERPAQLVLRLCDVAPDGQSSLIVRTVLNLECDDALNRESPFAPGARTARTLRFPTTAYRLSPGHRLRLAVGASYWPLVWPVLADPGLQVHAHTAMLHLPCLPTKPLAGDGGFPPHRALPEAPPWRQVAKGSLERKAPERTGPLTASFWRQAYSAIAFEETATTFGTETSADFALLDGTAAAPRCTHTFRARFERPDGTAEITSRASVRSTPAGFAVDGTIHVLWNDNVVFERRWPKDSET